MTDNHNKVTGAILGIHALTSLHPGAGTALGTVDLPVQRERHTQWPNIAGSALKGILRDVCREKTKHSEKYNGSRKEANKDPDLESAFGPDNPEPDSAHAGALAITDARILAFPVRSLRGVFAWVTCPGVLERLKRDLGLAQKANNLPILKPEKEQAYAAFPKGPLLVENKIVLEEFEFTQIGNGGEGALWANWIADNIISDSETGKRVQSHLVILHDDDFTHFVRHATEVVARIGLDYETKTVKTGALFYQEFLPPETLMYSVVLANASRSKMPKTNGTILEYLKTNLGQNTVLQIGGDETIGKGLCAVKLSNGKDGGQ